MTALTSLADGWAALAWAAAWQLAALALLAWLAEKLFRLREPRVRHALWWFVLVAPLLLAPGRLALTQRQAAVEIAVPTPAPVARVARTMPLFPFHVMPQETETTPSRLRRSNAEIVFDALYRPGLALAWLLGCAALALRLIKGHRRVRRMLAASRPVEDAAALEVLRALCATAGLRCAVQLRSSETVGAPVLYGIRRPVIVMPGWTDSLPGDELRALLAHEVAHVRRRDVLANLAQRVIEIPLFFHPGAWLASRRITLAREELCDAWALSQGADPASYARSLAAAAERAHASAAAASLGVVESRFTLLRRVQAILNANQVGRLSRPLAIALAVALLAAAVVFAAVRLSGQTTPGAAPGTAKVMVVPARTPMTPREIEAALGKAGVRVQRFAYEVAYEHRILFTVEEYVGGKRASGHSECTLSGHAGRNDVMLLLTQQGQQLSFSFENERGSVGVGAMSLQGYNAQTWGMRQGAALAVGKNVPIFVFAANREEVHGLDGTVGQIVAEYPKVAVVYARIERAPSAR